MPTTFKISRKEASIIAGFLRKKRHFKMFDLATLTEFVEGCEPLKYRGHELVWDEADETDLSFMVLIDGCIVVWDKNYRDETVDALLTAGQFIGEFELFGLKSKSFELHTVTDTRVLVADSDALDILRNESQEHKFCECLSISLMEKVRAQNRLLKVRTGHGDRRLAKFLDHFVKDHAWRSLTTINSKTQKDGFLINLYFDQSVISGLLSSQPKSIAPMVKRFVQEKIISVFPVDETFVTKEKSFVDTDFPIDAFPASTYFQFKLLNHTKLMNKIYMPGRSNRQTRQTKE